MRRLTGVAVAGLVAGAVLSTASVAQGVQVEMGLKLLDLAGNPLPAYTLDPWTGSQVNVLLSVRVHDPLMTSSSRILAAVRDKPLGIGTLTVDLVTTGAGAARFMPVVDAAGPPPQQMLDASYKVVFVTAGLDYPPVVGVEDANGNGVPDIKGTGIHVNPGVPSASGLPRFQVGAEGWFDLILHGYIVGPGSGIFELSTKTREITVFSDPEGAGALVSVDVSSSVIEARVLPIPEPGGVAVVGLACGVTSVIGRRRRT